LRIDLLRNSCEATTTNLGKLGILTIWTYEGGTYVRVLGKEHRHPQSGLVLITPNLQDSELT
jgi:hypothetical protein